jgi:TetR/AcrR family transcriptional regulator
VKRVPGQTRDAILAAAAAAFAALGFDGASVDDIAARAGVNKAMIYYHFRSKERLYVEILRAVFRAMGGRAEAIAGSDLPPGAKIDAFIDAFDGMAQDHPYMPRVMMREMAEGARHLDTPTLRLMAVIYRSLARILEDGARVGAFRPADPTLTYFSLITPVIFFRATEPIRTAFGRAGILHLESGQPEFLANLKHTAALALAPVRPAARRGVRRAGPTASAGTSDGALLPTARPRNAKRHPRSARPGDYA